MMNKYEDEIQAVEERLVREREALALRAEYLGRSARSAAASPKGLIVAAAIGFLVGELTRPRHHHHHGPAPGAPGKLGLGSLLGGVALALMRAQYGSPLGFGRAAFQYAAERRAARAAEADRAAFAAEARAPTGPTDAAAPVTPTASTHAPSMGGAADAPSAVGANTVHRSAS
jgi:hypothetical protein